MLFKLSFWIDFLKKIYNPLIINFSSICLLYTLKNLYFITKNLQLKEGVINERKLSANIPTMHQESSIFRQQAIIFSQKHPQIML
jgi:hypothetical protein